MLAWDVIEALHEMILIVPPPFGGFEIGEGILPAVIEGGGRSAPFALDATTWNIDTQTFSQTWAEAQLQLGPAIDATNLQRYDQLKNWNFNSQAKRDSEFGNITFIGVANVDTQAISANMEKWQKNKTSAISNLCTVAFVRDPLARFISGYVEFEWRFEKARKMYNNSLVVQGYTFHEYKLGSKQRAAAFVRDLVSFNMIEWLHELPPNLDWFNKHLQENPHLFHRNAIAHICPMVGRLWGKKIDFLGQLELMSRDWTLMADHCKMKNVETFNYNLVSDSLSEDPQGTQRAMQKAFADDCHLKAAVCILLKVDYDILSNHFDYKCTGRNNIAL